jgi:hypothetical protein
LFLRDYVHRYRKLQPQAILEQLLDEHHDKYDARNSKKLQQSIRRLRTKCFQKEFNLQKNSTIGSIDVMLREHEVDLTDPATHNTLDPHQPFTVEVEINVATSLALILVTTLHWLRNAVRSLATQASVLMHDTTHGLIFGGAQVWALGTVDVQHHGHRIALSIVNKAGGDANWYTKLLNKLKDCVNHVARHMHGTAAVLYAPIACLQDGADELSNAMKRVFPGIQAIMCYYHWAEKVRARRCSCWHEIVTKSS